MPLYRLVRWVAPPEYAKDDYGVKYLVDRGLRQVVWEGHSQEEYSRQLKMVENIPVPKDTTYNMEKDGIVIVNQ